MGPRFVVPVPFWLYVFGVMIAGAVIVTVIAFALMIAAAIGLIALLVWCGSLVADYIRHPPPNIDQGTGLPERRERKRQVSPY